MSKNRIAWLRVVIGQWILLKYDPSDISEELELSDEEKALKENLGPTYRVLLPRPGGKPITYDLTALTHEEFLALKEFWERVFELVEPVVIERDRVAQDAYEAGDDSFARIYRQVPQLVFREGEVRQHSEGLRVGSEDLSEGHVSTGPDGDLGGGLRGRSDGVVAEEPQDCFTEDNEPKADQP